MTAAAVAAAGLLFAAVLTWPVPSARSTRRLLAVVGVETSQRARAVRSGPSRMRALAAVAGGVGVALFVGLPWGVPAGALAVVAGQLVFRRLEPVAVRRRNEQIAADLPVAVDLLAACHQAGSPPAAAAAAVSNAVGGPVGEALQRVVSLLRLGGDPVQAWAILDAEPPLASLGRAVGRAMSSGAPVTVALEHVARDARQQRRMAAEEAARKVGVRATVPLGVCFLPAFVLLGVVPVAAGIATHVPLR